MFTCLSSSMTFVMADSSKFHFINETNPSYTYMYVQSCMCAIVHTVHVYIFILSYWMRKCWSFIFLEFGIPFYSRCKLSKNYISTWFPSFQNFHVQVFFHVSQASRFSRLAKVFPHDIIQVSGG